MASNAIRTSLFQVLFLILSFMMSMISLLDLPLTKTTKIKPGKVVSYFALSSCSNFARLLSSPSCVASDFCSFCECADNDPVCFFGTPNLGCAETTLQISSLFSGVGFDTYSPIRERSCTLQNAISAVYVGNCVFLICGVRQPLRAAHGSNRLSSTPASCTSVNPPSSEGSGRCILCVRKTGGLWYKSRVIAPGCRYPNNKPQREQARQDQVTKLATSRCEDGCHLPRILSWHVCMECLAKKAASRRTPNCQSWAKSPSSPTRRRRVVSFFLL